MPKIPIKKISRVLPSSQEVLRDPKIDLVREPFLAELARFCMLLALGQFLCVPPLYYMFAHSVTTPLFKQYVIVLTLSGILLCIVAALCVKLKRSRQMLACFAFGVLFVQTCYLYYKNEAALHPLNALFPILSILAPPILGQRSAYLIASISLAFLLTFQIVFSGASENPIEMIVSPMALLSVIILFSAYISEVLWGGVLKRESRLRTALAEVEKKADEMEGWIGKLGEVSSSINAGIDTSIPGALPYKVFSELTTNLEQMQSKLKTYFGNQLLQDRLTSIGILASGVAHELNTPLTTINFLLEKNQEMGEESKKMLLGEVDRMSDITHRLLAFGKKTEEEDLDLNTVIKESQKIFNSFFPRHFTVTWELCDQILPIRGIGNQVQQVFFNLLHNAIDATESQERPEIRIQTDVLENKYALLTIEDNGCGIDSENMKKVFDPFYTTKSPSKGTGLGLFIVHQVMQQHSGTLSVDSSPGKGTKLWLRFPLLTHRLSTETKEAA